MYAGTWRIETTRMARSSVRHRRSLIDVEVGEVHLTPRVMIAQDVVLVAICALDRTITWISPGESVIESVAPWLQQHR